MKIHHIFTLLFLLFSCKNDEGKLMKIDIFNENDLNNFIHVFLENQNQKDKKNAFFATERTQFLGNKLSINLILSDRKNWHITKKEFDSLVSEEDWNYIKLQIEDKKDYFLKQKNFKQKLINSDSLRNENIKFSDNQGRIIDSLRKSNLEKAKTYLSKTSFKDHQDFIKKYTPLLHFDKPIFFKDNKKVIFTYHTYSGLLNAYSETALYEFKDNKWNKVKILTSRIS